MQITNLLIHLHNNVAGFSFQPRHLELLRAALPHCRISVAAGNDDFLERLPEADCVLAWVFKAAWYERGGNLQAVCTPAAGHDWVAADPAGLVKTVYGTFHGTIMRESLLAMMLSFNRHLLRSFADQQQRVWGRSGYSDCATLSGQRALLIGFGSLGHAMAGLLRAFGVHVTGVKREIRGDETDGAADRLTTFARLEEELPLADQVVLLLPGGESTEGIFTGRHFAAMKPGSYLYNLGRGNCYAEADLLHALENGPLAGAGVDVFAEEPLPADSPLWGAPNLLITPHASAICRQYIDLFLQEWLVRVAAL